MRWISSVLVSMTVFLALLTGPVSAKKKTLPIGLIAASVDQEVVLLEPTTGKIDGIEAGPVAWLYPAPGGVLFAPDLVHGHTTVVDLRSRLVRDVLDGITMPHFGQLADRYVVVSSRVLVVSYPERAVMNTIDVDIEHPWQVEVAAGDRVLLVLERQVGGSGDPWFAAVMLDEGRPVYRRQLAGDIRRFAVSDEMGVLAMADAAGNSVRLLDPATVAPLAEFEVEGRPVDVVFGRDGTSLLTAVDTGSGHGLLVACTFKAENDGGVRRKERWRHPIGGTPHRIVLSPDGRHLAVALASGRVEVVDLSSRELVAAARLAAAPRDVIWTDPAMPGPLLPDWSDRKPPTIELGDSNRDVLQPPK